MKKNEYSSVKSVISGSIAEEAGIEAGDRVVSVDGERVKDILDYRLLTAQEAFILRIRKKDGELWDIDIEKGEYEDLGLEFENPLADCEKSCSNKCIFCFIDQLPPGMRETLYYKDDDSRLSFLTGNYITLTNMNDAELERIIRYRLSPVNVSVHTTNPKLRMQMLKNRFAGNVLERIGKLASAGIEVNCQIVLCRGINDGKELERSIRELSALYPGVHSISVVPVGLTRFREGLYELTPFDRESAHEVLLQLEGLASENMENYGSSLVYPADEFYVLAGSEIPEYNRYEDFPQLENGVGMLSLFRFEFHEELARIKGIQLAENRAVSIATGMLALEFIKNCSDKLEKRFKGLKANVYGIRNDFFGESVNVSGLVTGEDLIKQLQDKELGIELLIPENMLRAGETVFLDDVTVSEVEDRLGVKARIVKTDGTEFIRAALNIKDEEEI